MLKYSLYQRDEMDDLDAWAQEQLSRGVSKQKIKQALAKLGYREAVLESIDALDAPEERNSGRFSTRKRIELISFAIAVFALATGALFDNYSFSEMSQEEIIANLSGIYGNVTAMRVVGSSMEPFLHDGDIVLLAGSNYTVETGRIAAIAFAFSNETVVKRIAALPLEQVSPDEPYLSGTLLGKQLAFYNYSLPLGMLLVLGDNAAESFDSRHYGLVPENYVKGIVVN